MSSTKKLRRSAATLAEQIAESERAVASIETEFDQAESAAVEAAGEPAEYARAAETVSQLRARLGEERERLKRLRQSHAQAVTSERRQRIEQKQAEHAKKSAARERVWQETPDAVLVEVDRHNAAVEKLSAAYWGAEADAARAALELAELQLEDANERRHSGDDGDGTAASQIRECNEQIQRLRVRLGRAAQLSQHAPICKCSRPVLFNGGRAFGFGTFQSELETVDSRAGIVRRISEK